MNHLLAIKTHRAFKIPLKKITRVTGSCLFLAIVVTGCQTPVMSATTATTAKPTTANTMHSNSSARTQSIREQALHIQRALASGNYAAITNDIHPTRGVRFSMYTYVRLESDKVFSRAQFSQYLKESRVKFTWGDWDGTGDLLVTPLPTYLETWIEGKKFNNARVTVNQFESRGGMINNVNEAYPNLDVVDFFYKGTDEHDGMDWRGMRLVFDDYQGKRYLVAIINDQWTV